MLRLLLAAIVISPALSYAQDPWTVTLTPTGNPLPVGACAAVHLTLLDPSSRDVPRDPLGRRIQMADFDVTVTTPDGTSAAVQYLDAYNVSACGCQGAPIGTVGTVTATYPSRALAAKARVPGVAFERSATFTLAAAKGTSNPPVCSSLAAAPASPIAPTPVAVPSTAPRSASAPASAPVQAGRAGSAPPVGEVQPGGERLVPVNPVGFRAVQTGVGRVHLSWQPVVGVAYYGLFGPGVSVGGEQIMAGSNSFTATGVPTGPQQWNVGSYYTPGPVPTGRDKFPTATVAVFSPTNPKNFHAGRRYIPFGQHAFSGYDLSWESVSGASYYLLAGPGLPADGVKTTKTSGLVSLAEGTYTWTLATFYAYDSPGTPGNPGHFSSPPAEFSNASVTGPPPPAAPPPVVALRYRVSVLGLQSIVDTGDDDLFKTDGKRDELYVAAVICYALRPATGQSPELPNCVGNRRSAVHGDVLNYPNRIKAGTASATGGVMSGNLVGLGPHGSTTGIGAANTTFPFVLWEGTLLPGKEAVWISPSLWESDNNPQEVDNWRASIGGLLQTDGRAWWHLGGGFGLTVVDNSKTCGWSTPMGKDRPIGTMRLYPDRDAGLRCQVIGLTREKADAVLAGAAQEPGKPVGVVTITLNDVISGSYLMYLKLERLP